MSKNANGKPSLRDGSAPSGPSPAFEALLQGKISSQDYVRQLKKRVDSERRAEKRAVRRAA